VAAEKKEWETYEQVAVHIPGQIASALDLEYVEGKEVVVGQSGTTWETPRHCTGG
jgi:hypothetical protein